VITAFSRTIILYFLIMLALRVTGKWQLGQLEPSELVLTMMISDLAAVPMQDFGIPLAAGVIPILTLFSLSLLISHLALHHLRFRSLFFGTPSVLIRDGRVQQEIMRKNRYTIDELLEELRAQGYSSIEDIKYAVLENSGKLSLLPREKGDVTLPVVIISDGRILDVNLKQRGLNRVWLEKQLAKQKISSPQEVFLLTVDEYNAVFLIKKENSST
jgi:uncharacterized membrane protein YcaP (DUF421 family)